jgi:hypothetical protein
MAAPSIVGGPKARALPMPPTVGKQFLPDGIRWEGSLRT